MSTTPKLDAFIDDCHSSYITPAMIEIREHLQRLPAPQVEPTRYPSEAETRLIEAFATARYSHLNGPGLSQTIILAETIADAVIAATPQAPQAQEPDESEVEDLKAQVYSLEEALKNAREVVEIERRRYTQPTRYPSEVETRLIELVERLIHRMSLPSQDFASIDLATIKRDLGIV